MAKAATSGQARAFNSMIVSRVDDEALLKIDSEKFQKAINDPETFMKNFTEWVNNECKLQTVLTNAFTVGDIFRHRAEKGDRRLWLSDNTQNWAIKPNLKKVIPIRTDLGKLSEYCLPNNMNDSSIQTNSGNPGCMELEVFLCVMYLLIFQPELGKQVLGYILRKDKWYLFHVMVNGKVVAFRVRWSADEWNFAAYDFGRGDGWDAGSLFLYFAIA